MMIYKDRTFRGFQMDSEPIKTEPQLYVFFKKY